MLALPTHGECAQAERRRCASAAAGRGAGAGGALREAERAHGGRHGRAAPAAALCGRRLHKRAAPARAALPGRRGRMRARLRSMHVAGGASARA